MTTWLVTRQQSTQQLPENTHGLEMRLEELGQFEATLEQFDICKL